MNQTLVKKAVLHMVRVLLDTRSFDNILTLTTLLPTHQISTVFIGTYMANLSYLEVGSKFQAISYGTAKIRVLFSTFQPIIV